MPFRRATKQWPSSCSTTQTKNATTSATLTTRARPRFRQPALPRHIGQQQEKAVVHRELNARTRNKFIDQPSIRSNKCVRRVSPAPSDPAFAASRASMTDPNHPTILIIDDDAEIRYSLARRARFASVSGHRGGQRRGGRGAREKRPAARSRLLGHPHGWHGRIEALQHIRAPTQAAGHPDDRLRHGADRHRGDEIRRIRLRHETLRAGEVTRACCQRLQARADLRAVGDYKPTVNTEDYKEGIVGSSPSCRRCSRSSAR